VKGAKMATKAGVWIDHKQATVVLVTDAGQKIQKFKSELEKSTRPARGSTAKHSYSKNDFVAEDWRERKVADHRQKFYDEVIAGLRGAAAVLILGPGEAKGEFGKRIKYQKLRVDMVEQETTDKMTDRQLAAKVTKHFADVAAKKFALPKKAARKKVVKANVKKPAKKSRK
jgi:hypothetical protein